MDLQRAAQEAAMREIVRQLGKCKITENGRAVANWEEAKPSEYALIALAACGRGAEALEHIERVK